ncbi:MAG: hypothetical protein KF906_01445 [Actinobacteria bacterium]|nr:hypothetical protein [Actinomycetota bacterium]
MDQQQPGPAAPWSPSTPTPPPAERPPVASTTIDRTSDLDRPLPAIASLGGGIAAILLIFSLDALLAELDGDNRRATGIALALGFEVIGLAVVWLAKGRRMASAGLGLSAVGLVPLVGQLFIDPADPSFDTTGDFTTTMSGVLAVLALLWLVAYVFGPGRRYALYLGAALLALWLLAVVQVVDEPLGALSDSFESSTQEFFPSGTSDGTFEFSTDGSFDSTSGDDFTFSDPSQFDDDFSYDDQYDLGYPSGFDGDATLTKLGVVSLIFGALYLVLAAWRDRTGDGRMATPCLVAAIPILFLAVVFLANDLEEIGSGVLAIVLGAAGIYIGTAGRRRFTSWVGVLAVAVGIDLIVGHIAGDNRAAYGAALLVLGLALVAVLYAIEPGPGSGQTPTSPLAVNPGGPPPTGPHTWTAPQPAPGAALPTGPSPWQTPAPTPQPPIQQPPVQQPPVQQPPVQQPPVQQPPIQQPTDPEVRRDGAPPAWPLRPDADPEGPLSR